MLHDQIDTSRSNEDDDISTDIPEEREIHTVTTPPSSSQGPPRRQESWGAHSSTTLSEQFSTMSREFNAMVVAGSTMEIDNNNNNNNNNNGNEVNSNDDVNYALARIGEDDFVETNPLAIVPENNPIVSPHGRQSDVARGEQPVVVVQVKKEEVETKIAAWQSEEIAKVNNRFKRDEVIINNWENEEIEQATARLKKIERKLEEQRAKALEKTQNTLARAHRKAEDKRASAEAKRGVKIAKLLDLANFMRAVGRVPSKRSFF